MNNIAITNTKGDSRFVDVNTPVFFRTSPPFFLPLGFPKAVCKEAIPKFLCALSIFWRFVLFRLKVTVTLIFGRGQQADH
jgi:hypothetical protein